MYYLKKQKRGAFLGYYGIHLSLLMHTIYEQLHVLFNLVQDFPWGAPNYIPFI